MKNSEFQINNTQLLGLDYKINEDFLGEDISLAISTTVKIKNVKNKNISKVILTLNIFDEENIDKVPFYIKLSMAGEFCWPDNMDEEMLQKLLKINAPAILLSYSRPFISQLTSFSGYPPLILPLLDFTNPD